jgi:hypothetical protein
MYVGSDFDPIEPGETDTFTLEFTSRLAAGEQVTSSSWAATVVNTDPGATVDTSASSRVDGSATTTTQSDPVLGTRTFSNQNVGGCLAGNNYRLEATAITSNGRTLKLWSHVYCQAPN